MYVLVWYSALAIYRAVIYRDSRYTGHFFLYWLHGISRVSARYIASNCSVNRELPYRPVFIASNCPVNNVTNCYYRYYRAELDNISYPKCCPILANLSPSIIACTRRERVSPRPSNLKSCSISRNNHCHRTSSLNFLGSQSKLFRDGWLIIRRNYWLLFPLLRLKLIGSVWGKRSILKWRICWWRIWNVVTFCMSRTSVDFLGLSYRCCIA